MKSKVTAVEIIFGGNHTNKGCGSGSGNRKQKRWKRQTLLEEEAATKSEVTIRREEAKLKQLRNFGDEK